jgi:hypothetical protein
VNQDGKCKLRCAELTAPADGPCRRSQAQARLFWVCRPCLALLTPKDNKRQRLAARFQQNNPNRVLSKDRLAAIDVIQTVGAQRLPSAPVNILRPKPTHFLHLHWLSQLPLFDGRFRAGPGPARDRRQIRLHLHKALSEPRAWDWEVLALGYWNEICSVESQGDPAKTNWPTDGCSRRTRIRAPA